MNVCLLFLWQLAICLRCTLAVDTIASDGVSPVPQYDAALDNGTYGYYPTRAYATVEGLTSPQTNFLQWDPRCDDGLFYFVTPRGWSLPEPGPAILDSHGDLIWAAHFDNDFGGQAYDFMVQEYEGQNYLTFWLGDDRVRGHGSGFYYMLNSSYDIVHRVGAANGLSADLHEFLITPEGTALMTMYQVTEHDVTPFREFDPEVIEDQDPNYIWDCIFQEVDVATGDLIFEWRASDHVPINDTYHSIASAGTKEDPFDWFHINSIEKDGLGNYLISARYTHGISYIDGRTGDIIWTLGGRGNDFMDLSDGYAINFAWQHDARFHPIDTFPNMHWPASKRPGFESQLLTLFDNAAEDQHYEYGMAYSRGLLLEVTYPITRTMSTVHKPDNNPFSQPNDIYFEPEVNFQKLREINGSNPDYTVRLVRSYENPKLVHSSSQGSLQVLPQPGGDPKVLVGYGLNAVWTEFAAEGNVLCDAHFGAEISFERGDVQSYRVYKFAWTGTPQTRPALEISDDDVEVYVSWNGATDVVDWVLQCSETDSSDEEDWADVVEAGRSGFETIIQLPISAKPSRFLRIIALATGGRRVDYGISETIDRGMISTYTSSLAGNTFQASIASLSRLKVFLVTISTFGGMVVLYEGYRRYLSWKTGRIGGGPVRWRNGPAYTLIGGSQV